MSLISELKRRSVFRASAAYVVVSWLIVQVVDVVYPAFDFPDWSLRLTIIVLAVGFPVVVILAWIYEFTPHGLKRSDQMPEDYQGNASLARILNIVTMGLLLVAVLLFALDKFWWQPGNQQPGNAGYLEKSIAVLPFAHRSSLDEDRFFAEGIHDDLLTRLAKIGSLRVTSRTSVMQYRDSEKSIPEIGRELEVVTILEGGLQRSGDQVRINAQLIDAETDEHIWAETFDRDLTAINLFEIQSEITTAIANALQAKLSPLEQRQLVMIPTTNLAAYEAYLRGRQSLLGHNEVSYQQAIDEFEQAIELDPKFASAWAGICETRLSWYYLSSEASQFNVAESACSKAVELNRDLVDVQIALGALYRASGNYPRAAEELRMALEADPDNVDALIEAGRVYPRLGRTEEAEVGLLKAAELKPGYHVVHTALFNFYLDYSDYPERFKLAVNHALKAVELAPRNASAHNNLGTAYHNLQQYDASKVAWDRALELEPTRTAYTNRGLDYYYEGRFEAAAEMQQKAIELAPNDHRCWGRFAESSRFIDGAGERAADAYTTAITLAREKLQINDQDWLTMSMLANYLVNSGMTEEATAMMERALPISGRDPEALLYATLVAQLSGDSDKALELIAETLAANEAYRYYFVNDPDLKPLFSSEDFKALTGQQ